MTDWTSDQVNEWISNYMHEWHNEHWMTFRKTLFTLVTRRPYCPRRPKELCFTTLSLAMETMGMRLSMIKQSFFGPPGQYGCLVTRAIGGLKFEMLNFQLRTVPTKYRGFCAKLAPCGKCRSSQKLLESKKKNRGNHAFFWDKQPWISTKMLTSTI